MGGVVLVGVKFVVLPGPQACGERSCGPGCLHQQAQARFERRFSLPTLLVVLLANGGVLLGQALTLTGGNVPAAFASPVLGGLVGGGSFGAYSLIPFIIPTPLLAPPPSPLPPH